ncbi:MAG: Hint domain-containing protein [Gemmobacter sp.]
MATLSFWARTDSNTAKNPTMNPVNANSAPAQQITFAARDGGDVVLEFNGGNPDPDTEIIIGGVAYDFRVELSGTLPLRNSLTNVAGENLVYERIVLVTVLDYPAPGQSTRLFFLPDAGVGETVMNAFPNGGIRLQNINTSVDILICFVRGTLIATPTGHRPVERLRPGDPVLTADNRVAAVRWIGRRSVALSQLRSDPALSPVLIRAGALGDGLPLRDLRLSPQHRVMLEGWAADWLFGEPVLAAAKHLIDGFRILVPEPDGPVEYLHLMFDRHEVILAEGARCESFNPADLALTGVDTGARAEILGLFPELAGRQGFPLAAPVLRAHEAQVACHYAAGLLQAA